MPMDPFFVLSVVHPDAKRMAAAAAPECAPAVSAR